MAMIGKVLRMHRRDKKSVREIVKATSLSRNTVRKYLRIGKAEAPKYRRPAVPTKLTPFVEVVQQALLADARRPKKERRTAKALYAQLVAQGYEGGYTRLTDYIRQWRAEQGGASSGDAYVPLSFALGEAFQFDWSEEALVIGGQYQRLQVAHLKLCASRAFWLVAYPGQGHEMLFDAHTRAFTALGGVARRGIYDNMKTAVDRVGRGKRREVNLRFTTMCAHYLFDADFCNVASGWEKGVVEKNVQDSRRRIWLEAREQRFSGLDELNAWLAERCKALWSELRHPEHKNFSVAEVLELERAHLMPMPAPFDGYVQEFSRVSSTCLVTVARNRYSVPCELARQMVSTRLYPGRVVIVFEDRIVASHERLAGKNKTAYDWQHYIPLVQRKPGALRNGAPFLELPEPLAKLRVALLRHVGGDRLMAQVLALVPVAGLETVLVAADLALEHAGPSGRVSPEHVANVLARLTAPARPQNVDTALRTLTPPTADTARYDRLRQLAEQEASHD
ncbi:MAG: IS21 family transposase [Rubrivivax sp.]|nr:IS21 family transposase [Rubrivivax sp.]